MERGAHGCWRCCTEAHACARVRACAVTRHALTCARTPMPLTCCCRDLQVAVLCDKLEHCAQRGGGRGCVTGQRSAGQHTHSQTVWELRGAALRMCACNGVCCGSLGKPRGTPGGMHLLPQRNNRSADVVCWRHRQHQRCGAREHTKATPTFKAVGCEGPHCGPAVGPGHTAACRVALVGARRAGAREMEAFEPQWRGGAWNAAAPLHINHTNKLHPMHRKPRRARHKLSCRRRPSHTRSRA